jgi:hypothetical protein
MLAELFTGEGCPMAVMAASMPVANAKQMLFTISFEDLNRLKNSDYKEVLRKM